MSFARAIRTQVGPGWEAVAGPAELELGQQRRTFCSEERQGQTGGKSQTNRRRWILELPVIWQRFDRLERRFTLIPLCSVYSLNNKGKLRRERKRRRHSNLQEDAVSQREEEREEQKRHGWQRVRGWERVKCFFYFYSFLLLTGLRITSSS